MKHSMNGIPAVGTCCGRDFYTWEGWWEHQRTHRSRYRLGSRFDPCRKCSAEHKEQADG